MYQVIIVDNDPMVSYINREYVERDGRFRVVGEFQCGRDALDFLAEKGADLMILDICLPEYNGIELLKDILRNRIQVDVIMVTAAKKTDALVSSLHLGAVDYLVKPFSYNRFQQALDKYIDYKQTVSGLRTVDQETIDHLFHAKDASLSYSQGGAKNETEKKIMECFREKAGHDFTVKEFAQRLGLSTVTVRRYLKRLTDAGRVIGDIDYNPGGHPCMVYRLP
nr:response regulator [uncultured Christensenella sp.]